MSGRHGRSLSAYGVAPDRVYICTQSPVVPVSSYLAFPSLLRQRSCRSGLFLLHFPGGYPRRTLSVILPCSARTFLTLIPFGNIERGSPTSRSVFYIQISFLSSFLSSFFLKEKPFPLTSLTLVTIINAWGSTSRISLLALAS